MDPNQPYNPNPQNNPANPPAPQAGLPQGYGENPQPYTQMGTSGQQGQPQQPAPLNSPSAGYRPQPLQPNPYAGYNANPYPGQARGGKRRRRGPNKLAIIIIIVVLLLVVVGVIIAMSGGGNTPTTNNNTGQNQQKTTTNNPVAEDVVPRTDGQLELTSRLDTASSIKEQTIKAKIKEQVNLSSGFSFMVTQIDPYTSTNPAVKPAAGKKFVVVSAVVGNRAQANGISVSYLDFKLRDNQNQLLNSSPTTQEILGNSLANPTALKPGDQITGKIVFEVGATDTDWVFVHKENYQKTTDNTTFTVEGDIVVTLNPTPAAATPTPAPAPAT